MKKTKFSSLVKIKKNKLEEIERQILDVQHRKQKVEKEITAVHQKIEDFHLPQEGAFSTFQLSKENLSILLIELDSLKQRLEVRIEQIKGLQELYKEADIELEKFMTLHSQVLEIQKLELEKLESKEMDEIANILNLSKKSKEKV